MSEHQLYRVEIDRKDCHIKVFRDVLLVHEFRYARLFEGEHTVLCYLPDKSYIFIGSVLVSFQLEDGESFLKGYHEHDRLGIAYSNRNYYSFPDMKKMERKQLVGVDWDNSTRTAERIRECLRDQTLSDVTFRQLGVPSPNKPTASDSYCSVC